jgi:hypothetical protein
MGDVTHPVADPAHVVGEAAAGIVQFDADRFVVRDHLDANFRFPCRRRTMLPTIGKPQSKHQSFFGDRQHRQFRHYQVTPRSPR